MPASPKQLEANRRNALKSTGPKNTSLTRLNALKHGILSGEVLVRGEERRALAELRERLNSDLSPVGALEEILVDRIVCAVWRLKRCLRMERGIVEYKTADDDIPAIPNSPAWDLRKKEGFKAIKLTSEDERLCLLLRYETTIERQMYKALHELIRLQGARMGDAPPAPIAVDVDVTTDRGDCGAGGLIPLTE